MAPTEVLATQHFKRLKPWCDELGLEVALLTGSVTAKRKDLLLQDLAKGKVAIVIGTHALLENTVQFDKLGMVIIDEQHRFGVEQRARLQRKDGHPHVLTLSATPIPRTLALTLYGDLDVSILDELPPGRHPVITKVLSERDRLQAYELIHKELREGSQAYIVCPLVNPSEKLLINMKDACSEAETLKEKVFPGYSVGLLHGKMSAVDKEEVVQAFRDKKIQVLCCTTVVEVGVDVPNATVMLIENAERYGLATLHQLRGRVGRGHDQSYCILMSRGEEDEVTQRLKVMSMSNDGFFIAEKDLEIRGWGQIFGFRQAGLPEFEYADPTKDAQVLDTARHLAARVFDKVEKGDYLASHPLLRQELEKRFRSLTATSAVS